MATSHPETLEALTAFAVSLALEAGAMIRSGFTLGMRRETKTDGTPVTETDHRVNTRVCRRIEEAYPDHAFIGEEGNGQGTGRYAWVCDPIDGTIPYSRGIPLCTFSLALTLDGETILAVVYDPFGDRLLVATRGGGATLNGEPIRVSGAAIDGSVLSCPTELASGRDFTSFRRTLLLRKAHIMNIFSFVYVGILVATGEIPCAIYPWTKPWDVAAISLIVGEAGGCATNLVGMRTRHDREVLGCVLSNGVVHAELLGLLREHVL